MLFIVEEVYEWDYEGEIRNPVFTSLCEKEAINAATLHFLEDNVQQHCCDDFTVTVSNLPLGKVHATQREPIWNSHQNLTKVAANEMLSVKATKPTLDLLWNDSLPLEAGSWVDNLIEQKGEGLMQAIMANHKSSQANQMAWEFYNQYERDAA